MPQPLDAFLARQPPWDRLPDAVRAKIAAAARPIEAAAGEALCEVGAPQPGLFVIREGAVTTTDARGATVSRLGPGNSFGERALQRGGTALVTARADEPSALLLLSPDFFAELMREHRLVRRFFDRSNPLGDRPRTRAEELTSTRVADLMATDPVTCAPDTSLRAAAKLMRDRRISSLCVTENGALRGIVTLRDMVNKALAEAMPPDTPVTRIMTEAPITLPSNAIGSDVLHRMMERHLGHLPIVDGGRLVGMVTQTDLTRFLASTSAGLLGDMARAGSPEELSRVTARIPDLLVQLTAAGNRHEVVTRLVTDMADGATRRLIRLYEKAHGAAPAPFAWVACGSQGRQEQTGISDQDNALIISDAATDEDMAWFAGLAHFVSDGMNAAGYVFCPGDMMATNPRWRQRASVWAGYFRDWIARPSKEAQMLASVMFDLRVIAGEEGLFAPLHEDTLRAASGNSIFTAHMASNATGHVPPLGLLRGFATLRSGEHRHHIDLKLNGVIPVVDLARIYALQGRLSPMNTRARLEAAGEAGVISLHGARDLLNAYDVIAQTRIEHQARQIRADEAPDNFMQPNELSDFERSHLRDAFVVVKTMQAALMQGRRLLG
ncbi:putative nucleotidyltransferase substrate binding domain-containing protein (plasmid) [Limimaricola variabilis]|uniref:putative nucleotidyltransferase substrate binding domain-containing protein n=1 Tax=Limimaricola variabilis TaxID=1492771 RepID=UPI002AC94383|nr:putative nucleotidyltransferase substrate binding domain-containing protein [Limimaricola variabilis]WPY96285.1 putative nucleotidyltransferase substrate binding domain-containing protein [Limimaricola variabilis]